MPVYNGEASLQESIRSMLCQTWKQLAEIHFAGSTLIYHGPVLVNKFCIENCRIR